MRWIDSLPIELLRRAPGDNWRRQTAIENSFFKSPGRYSAFRWLDNLACSGHYDHSLLDRTRVLLSRQQLTKIPVIRYYLASLYLTVEACDAAENLLTETGSHRSGALKYFFLPLAHCADNSLPLPELDARERESLSVLSLSLIHI